MQANCAIGVTVNNEDAENNDAARKISLDTNNEMKTEALKEETYEHIFE